MNIRLTNVDINLDNIMKPAENNNNAVDNDYNITFDSDNCGIAFLMIPMPFLFGATLVYKRVDPKDINKYLNENPWFSINNKRFDLGKTTFSDTVIDLMDYIPVDQNIDCTRESKPGEFNDLIVDDNHGLKISMKFKNTNKSTLMRDSNKLWQFTIDYKPDCKPGMARYYSYIPCLTTEDKWLRYTKLQPKDKYMINSVNYYKYINGDFCTELWFNIDTKNLTKMSVRRLH